MTSPSPEAIAANDAGGELLDARRFAEAIEHCERASALAPDWYAPCCNLGVAYKHAKDFRRSLAASLRALELDAEKAGGGAFWNAGVAATALADWPRARWAWSKLEIQLPPGDGPPDMNIGTTPIRVCCDDEPEVVWCHRIDPARARIESIPTPETGRRYRDLLLHDGEPRGKRRYGERLLSVFNELAVLEQSPFRTFGVELMAPSAGDVDELYALVAKGCSAALEDWSASLEIVCKQCSEGVPHEHEPRPEPPWKAERRLAVATTDDDVFELIEKWAGKRAGRGASQAVLLTT